MNQINISCAQISDKNNLHRQSCKKIMTLITQSLSYYVSCIKTIVKVRQYVSFNNELNSIPSLAASTDLVHAL